MLRPREVTHSDRPEAVGRGLGAPYFARLVSSMPSTLRTNKLRSVGLSNLPSRLGIVQRGGAPLSDARHNRRTRQRVGSPRRPSVGMIRGSNSIGAKLTGYVSPVLQRHGNKQFAFKCWQTARSAWRGDPQDKRIILTSGVRPTTFEGSGRERFRWSTECSTFPSSAASRLTPSS